VPTPTTATPNEAEAVKGINDALNKVKEARNGTHEDYGKALDELEAKLRAELVANPEQALMADIEQSTDDAESDF